MNPITNLKNLNKMNDRELEMGLAGTKNSWHAQVNKCEIKTFRHFIQPFLSGLSYC
jgi:hypothetical protein